MFRESVPGHAMDNHPEALCGSAERVKVVCCSLLFGKVFVLPDFFALAIGVPGHSPNVSQEVGGLQGFWEMGGERRGTPIPSMCNVGSVTRELRVLRRGLSLRVR